MATFETLIEDSFGTSSHLDIDELRRLYYGRPNIYINFANDAAVNVEHIDLPDSIICYDVRDVVGRKVRSSDFYAHVFRINKSGTRFVDDVRRYRKEDLSNDISILRSLGWIDSEELTKIVNRVLSNVYIRFEFDRMWSITRQIALSLTKNGWREVWREVLMSLGYSGFSNPSRTSMLGSRETRTLYIDYEKREDLDILPIQKYRSDPRKRVEDKIERERRKMRVDRRNVAKGRTT